MKNLPPAAELASLICDNSDGDVLHDLDVVWTPSGPFMRERNDVKVRREPEPLTWLAEHKNYELSFSGWDDDPAWQVHSVNGGRNDREWTLLATGRTPGEALRKAMAMEK